mgnify:CR=1 FL=1
MKLKIAISASWIFLSAGIGLAQAATPVFINEIHYDNSGADVGEAIEIAGPANTDISSWSIVLYNGNDGKSYKTYPLTGTLADSGNGFGFVKIDTKDIQNGAPDGIALVNAAGQVVQQRSNPLAIAGLSSECVSRSGESSHRPPQAAHG